MAATLHDLAATAVDLTRAIHIHRSKSFMPPPKITADEWADTYRIVSSQTSDMTGRWDTSNMEIARGPMLAISDPEVRSIVIMSSAQIMKTTVLEIAVGFYMHLDPCPILFYSASGDTIDATITKKIDPMIYHTPELAALWGGQAGLESKNDKYLKHQKMFPGGDLELLTMGSTSNLRNRSAKLVLIDEVDDCQTVTDGDTVSLAVSRATNYRGSEKIVMVSTPTIKGQSRIEAEYLQSDMRKPYVECPRCGEHDYMKWTNVIYKDADGKVKPEIAHYVCEHCGGVWEEHERIQMLTTKGAIQHRQTKPFTCCDESQSPEVDRKWDKDGRAVCRVCGCTPVSVEKAGFWGWMAYQPKWSLEAIVRESLDCMGDRNKLQVFINNRRGETWTPVDEYVSDLDPEQFENRAEPAWSVLPSDVLAMTAGVDVQPMGAKGNGGLAVEIVGWGNGEETWSVEYHWIAGDPDHAEVWSTLDEILLRKHRTEDGRELSVAATAIDTGGDNIDAVVSFCSQRVRRRVWAIKGGSEQGVGRQPIWPLTIPTTVRKGARLYSVGTLAAKDWVNACISRTQPGPGYIHVPADRHASWYKEMLNTKRIPKVVGGRRGTTWTKKKEGGRDEALDCRVYAKAAFEGLKIHMPKIGRYIQSASSASLASNDEAPAAQSDATSVEAPAPAPAPVVDARPLSVRAAATRPPPGKKNFGFARRR